MRQNKSPEDYVLHVGTWYYAVDLVTPTLFGFDLVIVEGLSGFKLEKR